ncbi:quinate/shikimate dehydrogenase [Vagococcus martis]|uniref:Shikimate dehydrogenase (NADP(+)) n=1 Tax=Vagococcus martis TaxID=1768210 RepID=A0A1V4DEB2_9ENTE|nr:shikimate dehydrogenase [Vagococcus martis]OPF86842.1 quinate/shikimate dehydrogenase [Vagococcus martis]
MTERITGYTGLIGLMATPIKHSLSPTMHNEAFAKLGLDYVYLAFEVGNNELEQAVEAIRALGMRGSNVSMPNKQKVIQYLDKLSPAAEMVGAVNTIVNDDGVLMGHITDGTGFMSGLAQSDINIIGKKMTICGAGGAATAIEIQAALDGVKELSIFNRKDDHYSNAERVVQLINEKTDCQATLFDLADNEALESEINNSQIFTNATGVGMKPLEGQSLIKNTDVLRPDLVVADVVYVPSETQLLKDAKANGCRTVNGLGMMLWQGAAAFKLWTGEDMPVDYIKNLLFKDN